MISNCGRGHQLDVKLRGCTVPLETELSFLCLGTWPGPRGERFFALYNQEAEEFRSIPLLSLNPMHPDQTVR